MISIKEFIVELEKIAGFTVSEKTVSRWCRENSIPGAVRIGTRIGWRLPDNAVQIFIESKTLGNEGGVVNGKANSGN